MSVRNVHLFVFDSMADWQAAFAIAGINNPLLQSKRDRCRVVTVGSSTQPITTMGGLRILPEIALSEIDPNQSAMLILPGGDQWQRCGNAEAIQVARTFFVEAVPIAAICGATLALARAGMLDDFHHTSNSRDYLAATGYCGGSFYLDPQPSLMRASSPPQELPRLNSPVRSSAISTSTAAKRSTRGMHFIDSVILRVTPNSWNASANNLRASTDNSSGNPDPTRSEIATDFIASVVLRVSDSTRLTC